MSESNSIIALFKEGISKREIYGVKNFVSTENHWSDKTESRPYPIIYI